MKAIAIKTGIVAALALFMTISNGCKKTEMDSAAATAAERNAPDTRTEMVATKGMAAIRMTASADKRFGSVNVEVTGVTVEYGVGTDFPRWISIPVEPKIYNLMQLQDGLAAVLAASNHLPYGQINNVRLTFGTRNTVVIGDMNGRHVYPLQFAGADHSSTIVVDANINRSKAYITLGFNTNSSISFESEGVYVLKPVIKLKNVIYDTPIPNE